MVVHSNYTRKLAGASPSINRSHVRRTSKSSDNTSVARSESTERAASADAPRILLRDITKMTFLQADDRSLSYWKGDMFINIPN